MLFGRSEAWSNVSDFWKEDECGGWLDSLRNERKSTLNDKLLEKPER